MPSLSEVREKFRLKDHHYPHLPVGWDCSEEVRKLTAHQWKVYYAFFVLFWPKRSGRQGVVRIADLAVLAGVSRSTAKRSIKEMRLLGLLARQRRGRWVGDPPEQICLVASRYRLLTPPSLRKTEEDLEARALAESWAKGELLTVEQLENARPWRDEPRNLPEGARDAGEAEAPKKSQGRGAESSPAAASAEPAEGWDEPTPTAPAEYPDVDPALALIRMVHVSEPGPKELVYARQLLHEHGAEGARALVESAFPEMREWKKPIYSFLAVRRALSNLAGRPAPVAPDVARAARDKLRDRDQAVTDRANALSDRLMALLREASDPDLNQANSRLLDLMCAVSSRHELADVDALTAYCDEVAELLSPAANAEG